VSQKTLCVKRAHGLSRLSEKRSNPLFPALGNSKLTVQNVSKNFSAWQFVSIKPLQQFLERQWR